MQRVEVCHNNDLKEGSFRECHLGEFPVLVGRAKGRLFAVGGKCSHFGLPMAEGRLIGNRLRCPFHGACFNVHSGDIEDSPGLDCLPTFGVTVRESDQMILLEGREPEDFKRKKPTVTDESTRSTEKQSIVVIGGGPSAGAAVETLRQEGFRGKITLVSSDNKLPYDRTLLSKFMNNEAKLLREPEYFQELGIEYLLETRVRKVRPDTRTVEAETPKGAVMLNYTKLLVCTGLSPRHLEVDGGNPQSGIEYLYTSEQAQRISKLAVDANVVVVGSSFIAMESASFLLGSGGAKTVTVVTREPLPYASTLGEEVGRVVRRICESKGMKFVVTEVESFERDGRGRLTGVTLDSGHKLVAQLCLIAIGATPCTEFLPKHLLDSRGFVKVSPEFRSPVDPQIFAAGDVIGGGHWQTAQTSGRLVARSILGDSVADSVPKATFFWTGVFGMWLRYVSVLGRPEKARTILQGSLEENKFVLYYVDAEDRVTAAISLGYAHEPTRLANLIAKKGEPVPLSLLPGLKSLN